MNEKENHGDGRETPDEEFRRRVAEKEKRKLEARRKREPPAWIGLGMFGLVGWSVAIPTLIGIAVGIWLDRNHPARFSWTLTMLVVGVLVGCLNAWFWVRRESS